MEIIGYTHSDGYCLCADCGDENMVDDGNESGFVQPIFDGAEWDTSPTCDTCGDHIENVAIIHYPGNANCGCPDCEKLHAVRDMAQQRMYKVKDGSDAYHAWFSIWRHTIESKSFDDFKQKLEAMSEDKARRYNRRRIYKRVLETL